MSNYRKDCIFCRIIRGEVPAAKLYEDDKVLVMLDIRPASPKGGHTLVIPKEHYELVTELPDSLLSHTVLIMKKVGKALLEFGEGFNILQNNKSVAGQFVPHVHFHLIPRFRGDGITIEKWTASTYDKKEMKRITALLKKLISQE
jgi:histidine triad (HIT) family protein